MKDCSLFCSDYRLLKENAPAFTIVILSSKPCFIWTKTFSKEALLVLSCFNTKEALLKDAVQQKGIAKIISFRILYSAVIMY